MKLTQYIVQHSCQAAVNGEIAAQYWTISAPMASYDAAYKVWKDLYNSHGPKSNGKLLTGLLFMYVIFDTDNPENNEVGVYESYIKHVKPVREYNAA